MPILRRVSLFVLLFILWLLLSGHYSPLFYTYGIISCVLTVYMAHKMHLLDEEGHPVHMFIGFLAYFPFLVAEIIKANLYVAWIILCPNMKKRINPKMIGVKPMQKTDIGRFIFANSITLTPGTVSVRVAGEEILVHSLTDPSSDGLDDGDMNKRVRHLEEE